MGKKTVAAPNYTAAAKEQGTANLQAQQQSIVGQNPNVTNPYGTQTVTWTTDEQGNKTPNLNQTFSPEQQSLYDKETRTQGLLADLAGQGAAAAGGIVGSRMDLSGAPQASTTDFASGAPSLRGTDFASGAPSLRGTDFTTGAPTAPSDYNSTRKSVTDAMMSRANEDYAQQSDRSNSDLIAAGIRPGSKAYADRQQMIERSRNDARSRAEIAGGDAAAQAYGVDAARRSQAVGENADMFGASQAARQQAISENAGQFGASQTARQQAISEKAAQFGATSEARRQAISELLTGRQTPLNEITALMSGSQVNNPFSMPGYTGAGVAAPDVYGAVGDTYQAQLARANAKNAGISNAMSGLFNLGSAGIGAYPWS